MRTIKAIFECICVAVSVVFILLSYVFLGSITTSCNNTKTDNDYTPYFEKSSIHYIGDLIYFKDTTTNLCFTMTVYSSHTMTCVPCDSLKKVKIYNMQK